MESAEESKQTEDNALKMIEAAYMACKGRFNANIKLYNDAVQKAHSLAHDMGVYGTVTPAQVTEVNRVALFALQEQCDHSAKWQNYVLGFESTASTLSQAGLPKLAIRIGEILDELAGDANVVQDRYAELQQAMQTNAAIWNNALQHTTITIQETINRQNQVFETFRARWDNERFNKCPICGTLLMSRALPYCPNPSCHALVVKF